MLDALDGLCIDCHEENKDNEACVRERERIERAERAANVETSQARVISHVFDTLFNL